MQPKFRMLSVSQNFLSAARSLGHFLLRGTGTMIIRKSIVKVSIKFRWQAAATGYKSIPEWKLHLTIIKHSLAIGDCT